jgi:hypothetical protein
MTRTMLTIYAPFDTWLVKLAKGWRLAEFPLAPQSERGWTILLWRWEQPRVAYRGVGKWNHR